MTDFCRSSNDSTAVIQQRLSKLNGYVSANPKLKLYLSSVVMRIPSYNEDIEEPWYAAFVYLSLPDCHA